MGTVLIQEDCVYVYSVTNVTNVLWVPNKKDYGRNCGGVIV